MAHILRTIASGLAVALITGLTALAYANPKGYRALSPWIALIATALMLLFWTWSWGAESHTSYDKPGTNSPMMNGVIAFFVWMTLLAFLGLLYVLPRVLES